MNFTKGLRDLYDLHLLLTDFSVDAAFWGDLVGRARHLTLALPVLDALMQCMRLYETVVPVGVTESLKPNSSSPWPQPMRAWLFDQALRPPHASAFDRSTRLAHWLTFVRSHWLRLPLPLLVYHLSHKLLVAR